MLFKPRTVPVILLSSLVIVSVIGLSIFGSYAYLEWKGKKMRRNYHLGLYELNGQLFGKYIIVNLRAKIDKKGAFRRRPVVEGTIKNASNKKIYSLKLKIIFYDREHRTVYVDTFYPVGLEFESLFNLGGKTENFLREGDSISFKRQIKNCPPEVLKYLQNKLRVTKIAGGEPLEIDYMIEGMDIR